MTKHSAAATGPTTAEQLADWALSIRGGDILPAALQQAKLLLLDTLGCGIAGHDEPSARAVLEACQDIGGGAQCTVIGSAAKTSLPNAVLANGMLVRVLDLNDYVIDASGSIGGHPSDNIPVAFAAGEFSGRSGRDVLAAIVLGYEVYGRCKGMMGRGAWDGASLSGVVAPVMAGWLMGLDRAALAHGIALSVARAATSAVVRWGDMSAAKSLANALVAQNGVQAALLARHGVTGPLAVFDHPRGMKAVFERFDPAALTRPLPADSSIMKSNVKAYPCVATGQAAVAAAIELHPAIRADLPQLRSIKVTMADVPTIRNHQADKDRADPKSREAADHSFQFVIAAALTDGALGHAQFEHERWNDPALRRLMGIMEFTTDAGLAQRAPGSFASRIEAVTHDGRVHRAEVLFPPGSARGGLEAPAILAKFEMLTAPRLSPAKRAGIVDAAMALDTSPTLSALQQALAAAA